MERNREVGREAIEKGTDRGSEGGGRVESVEIKASAGPTCHWRVGVVSSAVDPTTAAAGGSPWEGQ